MYTKSLESKDFGEAGTYAFMPDMYGKLVLQAKSQLKAIYKDNADTIIGNCVLPDIFGR